MMAKHRRPWFPAVVVLFVLSCSSGSSSGSSGCGSGSSTQACDIDTMATTCPGRITLECQDGDVPDEKAQCKVAIKEGTETVYCCNNLAYTDSDGSGGN